MTDKLPLTPFRLGDDDVLFGAEGVPGAPYMDYGPYVRKGRQLQARAIRTAVSGLFRWAFPGFGTRHK